MRFRLIEADAAVRYDEEFTSVKQLLQTAMERIDLTEGKCNLAVLQWDNRHNAWIGISPATEALSCEIQKLKTDYIRLTLRGAENNE